MDYRRIKDTVIARIDKDESISEQIQSIAEKENIKTAFVAGIGAAHHMKIGCYQTETKTFNQFVYDGDFEITSLIGNITSQNSNFYLHLHINATDENGKMYGGHLNEAIICATCELQIQILDTTVERKKDDKIGINVLKFEK